MPRTTIIVDVGTPAHAAVATWLRRWRARLTFLGEYEGCGCCVDIWRVEGPAEALDELPPEALGDSEWSLERDRYERRP